MIRPSCITTIRSQSITVLNRCAMISVVRPARSASTAAAIRASLSASIWLVASSITRIAGSRRIARAMHSRCRCPPDSPLPPSPSFVSYPSRSSRMNPSAWAASAASTIRARGVSRRP